MPISQRTLTGKIARMPRTIRERVCAMIEEGKPGSEILAWLNDQPAAQRILADYFDGVPVSDNNLSQWKERGYPLWKERKRDLEYTKDLSIFCAKLAKADGGNMSAGMAAIMGGKIMEAIRLLSTMDLEDEEESGGLNLDALSTLTESVAMLRNLDLSAHEKQIKEKALELRERSVKVSETALHYKIAGAFVDWWEDETAKRIMEGKGSKQVKMDQLVAVMFGEKPDFDEKP